MSATKRTAGRSAAAKKSQVKAVENLFFSRDESWMRFNQRVLEEAQDETNPLLERVKFLAITASNLDEFVEIRVAGFLQRIEDGYNLAQPPDEGGLTPQQRLDDLMERIHHFVKAQYQCLNEQLLPALQAARIRILQWHELSDDARAQALQFYDTEVDPLLTPVTIDPSHPFPRVLNKALCIGLLLRRKRRDLKMPTSLGVVTVPRALPRLVPLICEGGYCDFILLHNLVESQVERMSGRVLSRSAFRNAQQQPLYAGGGVALGLESVRWGSYNRRKGDVVRMEIESSATEEMIERLCRPTLNSNPGRSSARMVPNLSRLMNLRLRVWKEPKLKYPAFAAKDFKLSAKSADIFDELRKHDVMLHHPFDSYKTVEEFIEAGSKDPNVISMKQTLYRTSKDSPIFTSLIEAGQSKEVTVVVELMARFDEDSNIRWARELEDAGVGVFHGIFGLKTHCKLALLVRRDPDGVVRRYAQFGNRQLQPRSQRGSIQTSAQPRSRRSPQQSRRP